MNESTQIRLSLCLPIQEQMMNRQRALIGDPGDRELFELPKYAYIFVMKDKGDGTWSVWRREERVLAAGDWVRTRYYGLHANREDSVFKYDKDIRFILRNETLTGKVFAICSNKKLNFNTAFNSVSNMTQVLDWKFDTSPDSIQENIQNIYSTPYNYIRDGKYYCTFNCTAGTVYNVDLLLYHVASKVDIKWHVDDEVRIDKETPANGVRLTYMEARRLYNGYAYCFQPMRNEVAEMPTTGYTKADLVTESDEGLWWEGRTYFYTIPFVVTGFSDYFPLQMQLCTNGTDKANAYRPTLNLEIDTSDVFVPWLRATFNISQALEDKEETINVNN